MTVAPPQMRMMFVATILASSFLLFLVQPLVARMALPRLGGAPAVWNSAMLVYQALLLGGYAYAHALGRVRPAVQAAIHLALLVVAMLWLPIGLVAMDLPADAEPAVWVPWLLALSIGPLFFAISAQAPLLQRWFSVASGGSDPYALYAASNLGSFAGLIAYPLLVEPQLALAGQSNLWSAGYVVVALLVASCAWLLPRGAAAPVHTAPVSAAPTRWRVFYWIALALVPSGLMLATTTYITTDIVAMPLLWVIPLGLYLLSFSVAFAARRDVADTLTKVAPITILLFGGIMMNGYQAKPYYNAMLALGLLFMVSVALHTALFRARPEPDRLTGFYLAMSVGGALGGIFAGLIAPVVFDWTWEYPILVLAAGALVPQHWFIDPIRRLWTGNRQWARIAALATGLVLVILIALLLRESDGSLSRAQTGPAFAAITIVGLVAIGNRPVFLLVLAVSLFVFGGWRSLGMSLAGDTRTRSYFGVYTVSETPRLRQLSHGTTVHGIQLTETPGLEALPTSYYVPGSGVGQAMLAADALYGARARIGVVGLGTGTLACYARPAQRWRFFEIDPAVVTIARDDGRFTFLKRCLLNPDIAIGDARLRLAEQANASLDLLALDAFSSDSVPMHLMTAEAFATYARVLAPNGLLLVHISNRFLDLRPVVSAAAIAGGWHAAELVYYPDALSKTQGGTVSAWIALSRDRASIMTLKQRDASWAALRRYPGFTPWSDDYSSILPLVKGL
ncbi:MAG: fused MFS/spermidine synthase [Pseudomonadota bacterium]